MALSIIIIALGLFLVSIFLYPAINIKNVQISTFWIPPFAAAVFLISSGNVPFENIASIFSKNSSISPVKILILFISMTFLSVVLDELGFFKYLAEVATKRAGKKQLHLFTAVYFLTAFLTVFTSNDIVILTFTPFVCFFCKEAEINPVPYLFGEFAAANTWSMLFLIGNPTNIYISICNEINFITYLKVMAIPAVCAGILQFAVLLAVFGKTLKKPMKHNSKNNIALSDKPETFIALTHLLVCTLFLIISDFISVEMHLIAAIGAISLVMCLICCDLIKKSSFKTLKHSLKRLPYQMIPFLLSMFIIVIYLNNSGTTQSISSVMNRHNVILTYGISSFLASNVVNNIPMSVFFSELPGSLAEYEKFSAVFATIIGSNIGAFLTPVGALAGIMFSNILKKHKIKFSAVDFVKYGTIVSLPTLTTSLALLSLTVKFRV